MKLISDKGRWATKDNTMIFSNIVWLTKREDVLLYHLIDENKNEIQLEKDITEYIVEE
jgi:hypothetical protein